MTESKHVVRRLVDDVITRGRMEDIGELFVPSRVECARDWIAPFRASFPDVRMEIVQLVAEGDTVAGRFLCSGTHLGDWRGMAATGRRFEQVDEVYFFKLEDGLIAEMWGLEDDVSRRRQLGLAS